MLELRSVTTNNTRDLLTIWQEAHAFKLAHGDATWETKNFSMAEADLAMALGGTYIVMAEERPAASFALSWEDERIWAQQGLDEQAGYIHRLAVRDAFRRMGIGQQAIDLARGIIKENERPYVRLDCSTANTGLCDYYKKHSFEEVDRVSLPGFEDTVSLFQKPA